MERMKVTEFKGLAKRKADLIHFIRNHLRFRNRQLIQPRPPDPIAQVNLKKVRPPRPTRSPPLPPQLVRFRLDRPR